MACSRVYSIALLIKDLLYDESPVVEVDEDEVRVYIGTRRITIEEDTFVIFFLPANLYVGEYTSDNEKNRVVEILKAWQQFQ